MKKIVLITTFFLFYCFSMTANEKNYAPEKLKRKIIEYYQKGKYKESIQYSLKSLNSYPDDEILLLYLAYSYEHLNDLRNAERRYLEIIKINPENELARHNLYFLYKRVTDRFIKQKKYNQAFDYIKKGEYYLPDEVDFFSYDATLNMLMGNYTDAYQLWKKCFEMKRDSVHYNFYFNFIRNMGHCALNLGRQKLQEWKDYVLELHQNDTENSELAILAADAYFYNNEKAALRNQLRNKTMQAYLKGAGNRKTIAIAFPLQGRWRVSSGYFEKYLDTHNGYDGYCIDLSMVNKTGAKLRQGNGTQNLDYLSFTQNIYSVLPGEVVKVSGKVKDNRVGQLNYISTNLIKIKHTLEGEVYYSLYVHLLRNSACVREGDFVKKGDLIGQVGNSGFSYAPHLHFGLYDHNNVSLPLCFEKIDLITNDQAKTFHAQIFQAIEKDWIFLNNPSPE